MLRVEKEGGREEGAQELGNFWRWYGIVPRRAILKCQWLMGVPWTAMYAATATTDHCYSLSLLLLRVQLKIHGWYCISSRLACWPGWIGVGSCYGYFCLDSHIISLLSPLFVANKHEMVIVALCSTPPLAIYIHVNHARVFHNHDLTLLSDCSRKLPIRFHGPVELDIFRCITYLCLYFCWNFVRFCPGCYFATMN